MATTSGKLFAGAMAFYHQDGLPAAWKQAMKFAGRGGRLATMPDIVAARLKTKPGDLPWETYFTTLSAEYVGMSSQGNRILIVAHGIGPMSTLDGIQKAYSWEYKDKDRNRRGGRITQQEFLDLESGKYGEVSIVDLAEYVKRYDYPFIEVLRASEAMADPVLKARFGPLTEDYVATHTEAARAWHRERVGLPRDGSDMSVCPAPVPNRTQHVRDGATDSNPYILKLDDAANCCYFFGHGDFDHEDGFRPLEDGYALAHLLSTGALCHLHHSGNESLTLDVSCHEWWNGVRIVGIKEGCDTQTGLMSGPDARQLLHKHWRDLLLPVFPPEIEQPGFCAMMRVGEQWFTQYPKTGERIDTWEPEYTVSSAEEIGDPVLFRTTGCGSMFFRFGVNEVQAIAPPRANAYFFVGEPTPAGEDHVCMVQFYLIEADASRRVMRADRLAHDYDKMMELLAKD